MQGLIRFFFPGSNDKLQRSVRASLLIRVSGLGLLYLSQVLLARLMGAKGYGEYTVIITALNFMVVLSLFGMDTSVLRFLPSYIQKKEYGAAQGFIRFSYRLVTTLAIVCSVAIFAYLLSKAKKFNISFSEAVFWSMLLLPFLVFVNQASSVLRALQKIKASLSAAYFLFPVSMSIGWYYYYNSHSKLPVDAAMMINLLCTVFVFIYIYRKVNRVSQKTLPLAETKSDSRLWVSVSSSVLISSLLNLLLKQSDILFVSHFLNNTEAGTYAAAAKMATLVSLGLSVVDYVYIPRIAAMWESKKLIGLQQLVREASRQILLLTIPIILVLVLAGKWLLAMFGAAFTGSYIPLIILVGGQFVNAATGMVGGLMMMTGQQRPFLFMYLMAFILQVFMNFLLIPQIGIIGAAIASSSAIILLNLTAYYFVRRKLKISAAAF